MIIRLYVLYNPEKVLKYVSGSASTAGRVQDAVTFPATFFVSDAIEGRMERLLGW